ncbi:Luc7-like protein [Symbiodinium microadriaticum]|uniref:Luc7-like protein n=1 Tax=Symbiodinium microadriaticum TaxID=2951 RepID=A0A1Q9EFU4_SYMMI|nr:Luc7-like protein [Symbiodinium microadriaticum]
MNKARAMLDALMGPQRDQKKDENAEDWKDKSICKGYLIGFCPFDKFVVGGKRGIDPCDKIHSEVIREKFLATKDGKEGSDLRIKYEEYSIRDLEFCVQEAEAYGRREVERLRKEPRSKALPADVNQKISQMKRESTNLAQKANALEDCEARKKEELTKQSDDLLEEAKKYEKEEEEKVKANFRPLACEVCGTAYISNNEGEYEAHLRYKIHNSYAEIRARLKELKDKKAERDRILKEKKEEERKKKNEEYMKKVAEEEKAEQEAGGDGEGDNRAKSKSKQKDESQKENGYKKKRRGSRSKDRGRGKSRKDRDRDRRGRGRKERRDRSSSRSRSRSRRRCKELAGQVAMQICKDLHQAVVLFAGCSEVQETFANCADGSMVYTLVPAGGMLRVGQAILAGGSIAETQTVLLRVADIYIAFAGGPQVSEQAKIVYSRGAFAAMQRGAVYSSLATSQVFLIALLEQVKLTMQVRMGGMDGLTASRLDVADGVFPWYLQADTKNKEKDKQERTPQEWRGAGPVKLSPGVMQFELHGGGGECASPLVLPNGWIPHMSGNVKFTFPVNTRQLSPSNGARSGTTSSSSGSRSDDGQQAYSPELCGGEDAQRLFDQGHPGLYNAGEEGLGDWLARFRYEFNAQLLDDLTSNTGSVRPRAHFEAEVADEQLTSQADDQEQLSNYVHLFEPRVTHDLCFLQTLMQKTTQDRVTYQRANGNLVQLDHAGTMFSWRNMVTDVHTIPGAALGSNHFQPQETSTQEQRPKHAWISRQTWQLIEQRSAARKRQDKEEEEEEEEEEELRLHKTMRSQARLAKQQCFKDRLAESEVTEDDETSGAGSSASGRTTSRARSHSHGPTASPQATASKLTRAPRRAALGSPHTDDSPVSMELIATGELGPVLEGMAANKVPAPDSIPSEASSMAHSREQNTLA